MNIQLYQMTLLHMHLIYVGHVLICMTKVVCLQTSWNSVDQEVFFALMSDHFSLYEGIFIHLLIDMPVVLTAVLKSVRTPSMSQYMIAM